jgi:hypothetical protein
VRRTIKKREREKEEKRKNERKEERKTFWLERDPSFTTPKENIFEIGVTKVPTQCQLVLLF